MDEIRNELAKWPVRTRISLTGTLVVARDIAHAKLKERLDAGDGLPDYMRNHAVYYAGPAKTPAGYASGSFGPTTAGRMDSYVAEFQERAPRRARTRVALAPRRTALCRAAQAVLTPAHSHSRRRAARWSCSQRATARRR